VAHLFSSQEGNYLGYEVLLADGSHAGFDKHRSISFFEHPGEKKMYHKVSWPEVVYWCLGLYYQLKELKYCTYE
jgi:hypothetical protein